MKRVARKSFSPTTFLEGVNGGKTVVDYQKDHTVFYQEDPADAVFYLKKGKVKLTVVSEQGKEAVVALLGPTDFCGEGCLTGQTVGNSGRNDGLHNCSYREKRNGSGAP